MGNQKLLTSVSPSIVFTYGVSQFKIDLQLYKKHAGGP